MMPLSLLAAVADTSDSDNESTGSLQQYRSRSSETSSEDTFPSGDHSKKRLARKAELARESRRRKKQYVQGLEQQIQSLKDQVRELQAALRAQGGDDSSVFSSCHSLQSLSVHGEASQATSTESSLSVRLQHDVETRRFSVFKSQVTLAGITEKALKYWPHLGNASISVLVSGSKQVVTNDIQLEDIVKNSKDGKLSVCVEKCSSLQLSRPSSSEASKRSPSPVVESAQPSKRMRYDATDDSQLNQIAHPIPVRPTTPLEHFTVNLQVIDKAVDVGCSAIFTQPLSLARDTVFDAVRSFTEQSIGTSLKEFIFLISGRPMPLQLEHQTVSSVVQPNQALIIVRNSLLS